MRDTIKVPLIVSEHTALRGSAGMAIHATDARSDDHSQRRFRGSTQGQEQDTTTAGSMRTFAPFPT